ncbi:MAG: hypothetical protein IPH16_18770 [Haliscomenobacter sp.]|nr:hypothetical protein [Haliscomenobacter sp.]
MGEQSYNITATTRPFPRDGFSIRDLAFPVLLGFLILSLSALTQSLLIFSLGLLQGAHILIRLYSIYNQKQEASSRQMHLWLVLVLFLSFAIILSSGHIFIETYWRFSEPVPIPALTAFWGIVAVFAGKTMLEKAFIHRPSLWTKLPEKWLFQAGFLVSPFAFLTMYWTDFFWIDALLGGLFCLPLFLGAVFASLDAYWRLEEIA